MAESPWVPHSVDKMEPKTVYILQMISIRKQVHNGKCSTKLAVDYPVNFHGQRWMGMEQTAAKCSSLGIQFHPTSLQRQDCWSCSLRSGWENCVSEVLHSFGWWYGGEVCVGISVILIPLYFSQLKFCWPVFVAWDAFWYNFLERYLYVTYNFPEQQKVCLWFVRESCMMQVEIMWGMAAKYVMYRK